MEDVMSSVRAGSARDPSLTATQLEDNPLLVRKVAWRDYFHWMVRPWSFNENLFSEPLVTSSTEFSENILKSSGNTVRAQLEQL